MAHPYPRHLDGFSYVGRHSYALEFTTDGRRPTFVDAASVDLVLQQILRAANQYAIALAAYCFMPDHLHLVVDGLDDRADCKKFVKTAKQLSGFHFKQSHGRTLWQRYGYERVLRDAGGSYRGRETLDASHTESIATRGGLYHDLHEGGSYWDRERDRCEPYGIDRERAAAGSMTFRPTAEAGASRATTGCRSSGPSGGASGRRAGWQGADGRRWRRGSARRASACACRGSPC